MFPKLFQRRRVTQDEIDRKKQLADQAQKLQRIVDAPEWAEVLLVKEWLQEDAGLMAVNLTCDDKVRFQGAVQYSTVEIFFKEISRRIKEGNKAAQELQEITKKK